MHAYNRLSQKEFIDRSNLVHNSKYDYSESIYNGYEIPIIIICPEHGRFNQKPHYHLHGQGCKKCGFKRSADSCRHSKNHFIQQACKIHGEQYSYDKVIYINNRTKVCIVCPVHGDFTVSPDNHLLRKSGCPECYRQNRFYTHDEFLSMANKVHGDLYDYSITKYVRMDAKIDIICRKHGIFQQSPESHLQGKGCTRCIRKMEYKLEQILRAALPHCSISTQEKIYSNVHERFRYFDFVIRYSGKTVIVEYDGKQHFQPVRFAYGMTQEQANAKFKKQQITDSLDAQFCKENGISLFRIKYNENKQARVAEIIRVL